MEAVKALMRYFSYLFHGLLAPFLIAVSGLALATVRPRVCISARSPGPAGP